MDNKKGPSHRDIARKEGNKHCLHSQFPRSGTSCVIQHQETKDFDIDGQLNTSVIHAASILIQNKFDILEYVLIH